MATRSDWVITIDMIEKEVVRLLSADTKLPRFDYRAAMQFCFSPEELRETLSQFSARYLQPATAVLLHPQENIPPVFGGTSFAGVSVVAWQWEFGHNNLRRQNEITLHASYKCPPDRAALPRELAELEAMYELEPL